MYHIVLMKQKSDATEADLAELRSRVQELEHLVPGIESITFGPNVSIEPLTEGYTIGFIVQFSDSAARDAYLPHPDHQAVIPFVQSVVDSVLVFDLDR